MAVDKPGKAFEKLVATIEQAMAHEAGRTVEYDKRIPHLVTGKKRQFDVVVTQGDDHHKLVTAIECKDHGRPVDVELVEAFIKKVEGCEVNRGILVSSNGFTDDARKVATASKISTLTLQEAEEFDWIAMAPGNFVQHSQQIDHVDVRLHFAPPEPDIDALLARGGRFVDAEDIELNSRALAQLLSGHIPWERLEPGGDHMEFVFTDPAPTASLLDVDGERLRPNSITLTAKASITTKAMDLAFHTYATPARDVPVASAGLQLAGSDFRLMLVRNEDETTRVLLVPAPVPAVRKK